MNEEILDNELILYDRLEVIKQTIQKYGEENFYLSFSGGKDSTVVHHLLDMAIPGNMIPRVYLNTGIEYNAMVEWVKELAKTDDRITIIKPQKNIKKTLEEKGYPFKSKAFSDVYPTYRKHKREVWDVMEQIEKKPELKTNYDFIHNLSNSTKWVIKEYYGLRERNGAIYEFSSCPQSLQYLFKQDMNISDKCCLEMKEKPLDRWQKEHNKPIAILGLMAAEGGRRESVKCIAFKGNKPKTFSPLAKVTIDWENWFIEKYGIQLCRLYYEPYNFIRSGCKGCPFNLKLEEDLSTLERYFPEEYRQCQYIWKPVYDEYRRIGYRLKAEEQKKLF